MKLNKLLIASTNPGKSKEIKALLEQYNIEILSASDFAIAEPEETGKTFIENAALKAKYYGELTNLPALADDSGMCVMELDEMPGIYSARFAGPDKDFDQAFEKIKDMLKEKNLNTSSASFHCALALWFPDGKIIEVEGRVDGKLTFPPRGEHKFGYDPIFMPQGYDQTFAEMQRELKNKISHRSLAFNKLIKAIFDE